MKVQDVEARLAEIRALADNDAVAHVREDGLWREVLSAIATGTAENPAAMAALALTSEKIEFARWYD